MFRPGDTPPDWFSDIRSCRSCPASGQQTNLGIIHELDVVWNIDTVSLRNLQSLSHGHSLLHQGLESTRPLAQSRQSLPASVQTPLIRSPSGPYIAFEAFSAFSASGMYLRSAMVSCLCSAAVRPCSLVSRSQHDCSFNGRWVPPDEGRCLGTGYPSSRPRRRPQSANLPKPAVASPRAIAYEYRRRSPRLRDAHRFASSAAYP